MYTAQPPRSPIVSRLLSLFSALALILFHQPAALASQNPQTPEQITATINSPFPARPPLINGIISSNEWDAAVKYHFPYGVLMVMNDYTNIYILIDVTSDTHADASPAYDMFWLTVDVNRNGAIDPNVDLLISYSTTQTEACLQRYLGPNVWTGCSTSDSTAKYGFGVTSNSAIPHRYFETAISRAEISPAATVTPLPVSPTIDNQARIGLRVVSGTPAINYSLPTNHTADFVCHAGGRLKSFPNALHHHRPAFVKR